MTKDNQHVGIAKVKPNWDFWGLIDLNGNYLIEPIYHDIFEWNDGIALLEKIPTQIDIEHNWTNHYNGEYWYVDSNGKMITDCSFGYAKDFSNGFASVNKNNKWGFINKDGKLAITFDFDNVHAFKEERCVVSFNNKWGLIDKNGNWIIENTFDSLTDFSFGLGVASIKSGLFLKKQYNFVIDTNGNKILNLPKEWAWFQPVSEKLILIGTTSGYPGERIYGFMDLQGRIKTKPQFYTNSDNLFDIGKFHNGKLFVETKDGKKGFVNEEGEFEISNKSIFVNNIKENDTQSRKFDEILEFSEDLAVAKKGNLWGVIDQSNNVIIDFKYQRRFGRTVGDKELYFSEYFPKFSCGLIGICEKRDTIYSGYIDKNGKTAKELKFRIAEPFYTKHESLQ